MVNITWVETLGGMDIPLVPQPPQKVKIFLPPAEEAHRLKAYVSQLRDKAKGLSCKIPNHKDSALTIRAQHASYTPEYDFCCTDFLNEFKSKVGL